jgi:hypothetical protein
MHSQHRFDILPKPPAFNYQTLAKACKTLLYWPHSRAHSPRWPTRFNRYHIP